MLFCTNASNLISALIVVHHQKFEVMLSFHIIKNKSRPQIIGFTRLSTPISQINFYCFMIVTSLCLVFVPEKCCSLNFLSNPMNKKGADD